jgi:hypothetical protein
LPNVATRVLGLGRSKFDWQEGGCGAKRDENEKTTSERQYPRVVRVLSIFTSWGSLQEDISSEGKYCGK